jgi:hypothetical protein
MARCQYSDLRTNYGTSPVSPAVEPSTIADGYIKVLWGQSQSG